MSAPRRVLVTGADGFIGSHLAADQAERGRSVVALDLHVRRVAHLAAPGRFEPVEGDVTDPAVLDRALDGCDTVFHLAAAHLGVGMTMDDFRRVNVDGVRTLAEKARAAGVRRFVHCSSVGVFGRVIDPPADEESPCRPELAYERTKLEGEGAVLEVARSGLPTVVIRPAWVYGPGCPRTEKLFRSIRKGRFVVAGGGEGLRHCVYIRDMVRAFDLAADADAALGQVIIVGDAGAVTVRYLVDEMARVVGARRPPSVPMPLLAAAGALAELVFRPLGKEPPVSRRTLRFFTGNTAFDIARAGRLLGYEPAWSLADGLAETWAIVSGGRPSAVPLPRPSAGRA
jgi:nucleoside-diphosphate-sugar epimerase